MEEKIDILGIKISKVNMGDAIDKVTGFINSDRKCNLVVTPNSEMVIRALDDPELADILNQADLSIPDGAGIVLASRLLRTPLDERVAGFDMMMELLSEAAASGYSIYFLGGSPGVVDIARDKVKKKFPAINICGSHHGYLDMKLQENVISELNRVKPDLLFVGMGVPLQEKFIYKNRERLQARVAMTVGGAFDVLAGQVKRAPIWMQNAHLEWLFRLLQEPGRLGRYFALPRFVYLVVLRYLGLNGRDK